MKKQTAASLLLFFNFLIQVSGDDGFISTQGSQFMLNGSPFYANGFNAYWLMYFASNKSEREKVSSVFQEASNHGLFIARTWAFSDGGVDSPLQYSPGSYNELMFRGLDFVVSEARNYGLKLILSLVNNYNDYGGKKQYVDWARNMGQNLTSDDDFFTNDVVKGYYKNHIKAILTRRNSITGIVYKDDPAIMAWELMNEPRCYTDTSAGETLQAWILEMASYLKSIDSNHLLEVGEEGFYGQSSLGRQQYNPYLPLGTDFIQNNQIGDIDFATVHCYPDQWLVNQSADAQHSFLTNWLRIHIEDAQNFLHKPILFTEYGRSSQQAGFEVQQRDLLFDTVYSTIYSSASRGGAAAGGLFWHMLKEGMDSLRDGYEIILNDSSSTASIITQQSQKLNKIRKMYARLANLAKWENRRGNNNGGGSVRDSNPAQKTGVHN